ncbi:MAG: stage II sporulation protein P [Desulfotomaculaceae bacterium]|nr:stage II sporulation protein P [Desulfotomaculaceae bacterium]
MKNRTRFLLITFTVLFFIIALSYISLANRNSITALSSSWFFQGKQNEAPEYQPGRCTMIIDEQENVLSMMSRAVYAGDEIYTADGKIYRLDQVQGDLASARFLGMDQQIVALNEFFSSQVAPVTNEKPGDNKAAPASFAIYHTHSAESYIPTEGTHSMRFKGGIFKVGAVMAERLKKAGMGVNHDQTAHDPHDNNAYVRSRRTAAKLLGDNPVAMFDVHRDGVPDPNFYREKIYGMDVASIRLVIGRQNPRMSANLDFAKQMLSAVNNVHPKVVKEIFVGKGDYNQDLLPTSLLIEAGTYTNSREEAERGVDLFAEALPLVLGISPVSPAPTGTTAPGKSTGASGGAWKAVGWILGMTVIGALAFLSINNAKLSDIRKRLIDFSKEIMPLIPRQAARKLGIYKKKNE